MISILALGFLIGMQHALEADHVSAVASMAARTKSVKRLVVQGAVWGLGHSLALLLVGGVLLSLGKMIPEQTASLLEAIVGVMLVGLGLHLVVTLMRQQFHIHVHKHEDGVRHIHAHAHAADQDHDTLLAHTHGHGFPARAMVVGLTHGLAGTAALIVLAAGAIESTAMAISYIAVFGVGSIVGMAVLSGLIAVPLSWTAKWSVRVNKALQAVIGTGTIALGVLILF